MLFISANKIKRKCYRYSYAPLDLGDIALNEPLIHVQHAVWTLPIEVSNFSHLSIYRIFLQGNDFIQHIYSQRAIMFAQETFIAAPLVQGKAMQMA